MPSARRAQSDCRDSINNDLRTATALTRALPVTCRYLPTERERCLLSFPTHPELWVNHFHKWNDLYLFPSLLLPVHCQRSTKLSTAQDLRTRTFRMGARSSRSGFTDALCLSGCVPFHREIPVPSTAWGNYGLMVFQDTFYLILLFTDDLISCYLPPLPFVLWQIGQGLRGFRETENFVYQDWLASLFLDSISFHYSWHDCMEKLLELGFPLSVQFFLHLTTTRKPWVSAPVQFGLSVIPKSEA